MKSPNYPNRFTNIVVRFSILTILALQYNSCIPDEDPPFFTGPSEIKIEFESGILQGLQFNLISNSAGNDHEFRSQQNINKVLVSSLKSHSGDSIVGTSFINWAWVGAHETGNFLTVFANDPTVTKSGDLQIVKTNGDEYIAAIPSNILCQITAYTLESIQGEMNFTTKVDYRIQNISKRTDATIRISFTLVRGPDF